MEVIFLPEARDAVMGQRGVKKRKNDSESNWRLFFSFFFFFVCSEMQPETLPSGRGTGRIPRAALSMLSKREKIHATTVAARAFCQDHYPCLLQSPAYEGGGAFSRQLASGAQSIPTRVGNMITNYEPCFLRSLLLSWYDRYGPWSTKTVEPVAKVVF